MGTTVALLRSTYVDGYLGRTAGQTIPWSDPQVQQHITDALTKLWPDVGSRATGVVTATDTTGIYTIPASIKRVSRIVLEYVSGGKTDIVDTITNWRYETDTTIRIQPRITTLAGLSLRVYGWKAYLADATDLPTDLEATVAERAAALAYGSLAGQLANSQRQQGLDSGRVIDYQTAVGMSAYYERRYQEAIDKYPAQVGPVAPRAARR
ncbi:MAG TPA: hypothetical protein VIU37_10730 [Candidatus Limnocylindrales bacterium]